MASQKLILRVALPYKSIHNNRDVCYDQVMSIFFRGHRCGGVDYSVYVK